MNKLILPLVCGIIIASGVSAHEEPAKTLKEKKEKEEKATFYKERNVASYTVWKHELNENKPVMEQREKFLTTRLDQQGNMTEMLIYKNTDTLDYRVAFTYDGQGNMIGDTDFNPDGSINENIMYSYDYSGRVIEQLNYAENNSFDSRFTYEIDRVAHTLTLTKFKPLDSIEYLIIYKYDGPVDEGNNSEIIKKKPGGELVMRVENRYNEANLRTRKSIYDENNALLYFFEYEYVDGSDLFSKIVKKSPENEVISETEYSRNDPGLIMEIITRDGSGNLTSFSSYSYEINP